jgi:nicotinamidase-related amidase
VWAPDQPSKGRRSIRPQRHLWGTDRGQARISPFVGTDLETLLRATGINTLVLAGVHTSGVVLSAVRHAGDLDYRLVVVRDCCADLDADVHAMLLDIPGARKIIQIDR